MTNHVKNIEILKNVCAKLSNGWIFNHVLSEGSRYYFLSNGQGMFIKISFDYGKPLPQWSFCFKHPKYKEHYPTFAKIGCSFSKKVYSIVSDIKQRLFYDIPGAYIEMKKVNDEYDKEVEFKDSRAFVIESISKVLNIQKSKHHSRDSYEVLDDHDDRTGSLDHIHGKEDKFNLHLLDITAQQAIQIFTLLKNK